MKSKILLVCLSGFLLAGCHLPDRIAPDGNAGKFYQPYVGSQTNWPVAASAYVTQQGRFPVYHGLPAQPYTILGRFDRPNIPLFRIARVARLVKADAILMAETEIEEVKTEHGMSFGNQNFSLTTPSTTRLGRATEATAYLIQIRPKASQ